MFTCLLPGVAQAHAFDLRYVLPIPFWIYVYACMAMLVVTFAAVGYVFATPVPEAAPLPAKAGPKGFSGTVGWPARLVLRGGAMGLLLLSIAAGFIGTDDPLANINMTLFWVVFLPGFAWLTAFTGDMFAFVNPWAAMLDVCERCGLDLSRTRLSYPTRLGYLPALCLYAALIWIELFTRPRPFVLSSALVGYSTVVFAGAWLFGRTAWLRYGEFFGVFFRLIGTMAPVAHLGTPGHDGKWRWRLRPPFSGLVDGHPEHLSVLLFVLFMLSSTTFDGLHETQFWLDVYWKLLMPHLLPLWGADNPKEQAALIIKWHAVYQQSGLFVLLALYAGIYLSVIAAAKKIAGARITVRELALRFAFSLIPIAFVYNVTHDFTLLVTQMRVLPWLVTDPFGFGWNLLRLGPPPEWAPLDMGFIWHTEVALILTGHLVSVCVAHMISLRVFPSRRQALLSQVPMLLLMIVYTSIGLWILSLHLSQRITADG
jgi:hypothetical protein